MNEVEFQAFKEFLDNLKYEILTLDDYENIFIELGGEDIFYKQYSHKWIMYTMCHNLDPHEGSPKLEFYLDSRNLVCYTNCGYKMDIIQLVRKRFELMGSKKSVVQATKWICNFCNIPFKFSATDSKDPQMYNWKSKFGKYTKQRNIPEALPLQVYDEDILDYFEDKFYYEWIDEGIPIEAMKKYNIKWYPVNNQIVIPCYSEEGLLVGIRVRNLDDGYIEWYGKYVPLRMLDGTQYNFPTNQVFFGENHNVEVIKRTKTCMIVEAEKCVMKGDDYLGEENNFMLGLYGHRMSMEKIMKLVRWGVNTLIIGIDSDFEEIIYSEEGEPETPYEKFEKSVLDIYNMAKPYFEVYVVYNNQGYKNCYKFAPTDYTKQQFDVLMEHMERIDL